MTGKRARTADDDAVAVATAGGRGSAGAVWPRGQRAKPVRHAAVRMR